MKRRWTIAASAFAATVVVAFACEPVAGIPRSSAPLNVCVDHPCAGYSSGARSSPSCNQATQRCELALADRPADFTVVVTVPETSTYAPGYTFAFTSRELNAPSITPNPGCVWEKCLALPDLGSVSGGYAVQAGAAASVGLANVDYSSVPLRATFVPLARVDESGAGLNLPLDNSFTASERFDLADGGTSIRYSRRLSPGRYRRTLSPQPPFDEFFPPAIADVVVAQRLVTPDDFVLTDATLDDPGGTTRVAEVERAEGLEGFRIWIERDGSRISSIRSLAGTNAKARLDTVAQSIVTGAVDVVLAPSDETRVLPRLVNRLIGGSGLKIVYPSLPPSASLRGRIGIVVGGAFNPIPARIALISESLFTINVLTQEVSTSTLIRYETSLRTDDAGAFEVPLPAGNYGIVIEPQEGTGFGKVRRTFEIRSATTTTFTPPPRAHASGLLVLSDGRPLARGRVFAVPSRSIVVDALPPRPAQALADDDGRFELDLDTGPYDVTVEPEPGTGFPRVVSVGRVVNPGPDVDLGTFVVPLPTRFDFDVRDTQRSPVPGAVVRVFATSLPGETQVEIGAGMSDAAGHCEILLARELR